MPRSKRPRLSAAPQHTAGNASSEDAGDVPVPVPPGNLLCPISLCMYRDPVVVVESGHTYDRSQIMQHFARRQTDPKTNRRLHSTMVVTNWAAREKQEVARGVKRKRAPPTKGPCEHGVKPRSSCKVCSACPHGKRRRRCKECGGTSICEHGCVRSKCKDCGGGSICEHGRERFKCKECGGSGFCQHGRQRSQCKDCGGSQICKHGRRRDRCKECKK